MVVAAQVVCGNRAGCRTVLLDQEGRWAAGELQGEQRPTHTIRSMADLKPLLQKHYELRPPPPATAADTVLVHPPCPAP